MSEILERGVMILRVVVGEAEDDQGNKYEMTVSMASAPLLKSKLTGRTFALSWSDILEQAIEAGINEKPTPDAGEEG